MPVFTDLSNRVRSAPFDKAEYDRRLPVCQEVARRMVLVHVTGKGRAFEVSVVCDPQQIPTSADVEYYTDETRSAEDRLGLPRSAYFYAGRANPSLGNLAMAFSPDCENSHSGSVTSFDTGGLMHRDRKIKLRLTPTDGDGERAEYGKASVLPLRGPNGWRDTFAQVLAAYFAQDSDYWQGRPQPIDPEGLYELNTDWRAWTFEVRFSEPQPICTCAAWCADEAVMNTLRRLHAAEPLTPPGDPPAPLSRFLAGPAPLEPAGTPHFCSRTERWAREQAGL